MSHSKYQSILSYSNRPTCVRFRFAEALAVFLIVSLLLCAGILDYHLMAASVERVSAITQLTNDLENARSGAIAAHARSIVQLAGNGSEYIVGLDYEPFSEVGATDEVVQRGNLPRGVAASFSSQLIFDDKGRLIDLAGALTHASLEVHDSKGTFASGTVYPAGFLQLD